MVTLWYIAAVPAGSFRVSSIDIHGVGMTSQRTRERLVQRLREGGISDPRVLEAMRSTPRHLFVEEAFAHRAYEDTALPIGFGQTISQPYIVALMTQTLLSRGPRARVLEVGTGSGYQAAVLAQLVERVYTVERVRPLLLRSQKLFRKLRLRNIESALQDGGLGWPQYAPYDAIITTAAPEVVPDELLQQLAPDGLLVIPVGLSGSQELRVIVRQGDSSRFEETVLERVRFVPLLSGTTSA
ncbi:MAG: protein-L-isoaspartate O-methyltransferase [Porticoccaceae bacterium]|nr:protein-L-isoaspartate O-methyltransferase [Porticoccaceae bacterium]